jgi:nuclear pore complex protein Nup205
MTDRTSAQGNEMWISIDQWISGSGLGSLTLAKSALSPIWSERHAFQKIAESFDQTNAFVELMNTLASPSSDMMGFHLFLPFPESLGSSYRMPGIEPYVDFVLGQALASKSVDLQEKEARLLQLNCFKFAVTCLETFNENLIAIVNQPSIPVESVLRSSSLDNYVRLHPFARVMEWLFNDDVLKAIFAASHQDIDEVAHAPSDSTLIGTLVRSIDVMNLILDHQSTYFDVVRPLFKSQSKQPTISVANPSLASFEDGVMDNLHLITDLCLYCGTGHPQLTLTSLALLEKLSSSRKLNKVSSSTLPNWQSTNQIVEVLNTDVDADRVTRSLASQMKPDVRELESGPESSGYLIKIGLLSLLDRCLDMNPDMPTMAHLLLGFSCLGNSLDVPGGDSFENNMSLLHAIIDCVQNFPDGSGGVILYWTIHMKRLSFQVLQHLWASKLSAALVLPELIADRLLANLFIAQRLVDSGALWDYFRLTEPEFWFSDSALSLSDFLSCRSLLFEYALTEIRFASKQRSSSLQKDILSTLLGNSTDKDGQTISHASIFDLFDFADLDTDGVCAYPDLKFLKDAEVELCTKVQNEGSLILYDIEAVKNLLRLTKGELLKSGQAATQDEEQLSLEMDALLIYLRATNESRRVQLNRYLALRSWAELATAIVVTCDMDPGRRTMFILHVLQVILPKLETSMGGQDAEAIELARLAETLIDKLDNISSDQAPSKGGDIIDERLYHLFQTCICGIPLAIEKTTLRECFYNICSQYLFRITRNSATHNRFRNQAQQAVKTSGSALVDVVCDDAYSGHESCRVSALLLLNLLAVLDRQEHSSLLMNLISQSNYLGMFVDAVRAMPMEFRNAQASGA